MLAPRALAPGLAAALGAFATLSCAGLLGIDDEQGSVASELCKCEDALTFKDGSCEQHITHRLEIAAPATRRVWMENFDKYCGGRCQGCWNAVFFTRPTCTDPEGDCAADECKDCCYSTDPGAKQCSAQTP